MPDFAVIVPTLNEKDNVPILAKRLETLLAHLDWEVVFVDDDSTDGTLDELYALAKGNHRFRYLRRVGRRGLASACVEGMLSTTATYLAVIDADLQHDDTKLPEIFSILQSGEANLVVASRYLQEGGTGEWDKKRIGMSKLATWIASKILPVECSDPMSGFFGLHRTLIDQSAPEIQSKGFKILFDLLTMRGVTLSIKEIPYVFGARQAGTTKMSLLIAIDFLWLLLSKTIGRFIYAEFALFCFVGLIGVAVHLGILFVFHRLLEHSFLIGQTIATLGAMTSNYALNNAITFRAQRLKGMEHLWGYAKFVAGCAFGAFVNIAVADYLASGGMLWLPAACVGVGAGAIINFFFAKFFIWKKTH